MENKNAREVTIAVMLFIFLTVLLPFNNMKNIQAAGATLEEIVIQTTAAADGCHPDYSSGCCKVTSSGAKIDTSYSTGGYKNGILWTDMENKVISVTDTFVFADTYKLHMIVKADSGYNLPTDENAYKIRFRNSNEGKPFYILPMSGDRMEVVYDYTAKTAWSSIDIEIPEPIAGEKVAKIFYLINQYPQNSFYAGFVEGIDISNTWYESVDGETYYSISSNDVYKEDCYYKTLAPQTIVKYLKDNFLSPESSEVSSGLGEDAYGIKDNIAVIVNGYSNSYNISNGKWNKPVDSEDDRFINGYLVMPEPMIPVKEIQIYGYNPPTTGKNNSYTSLYVDKSSKYQIYTGADNEYRKNGIVWGEALGGVDIDFKCQNPITFVKGSAYYTKILVKTDEVGGFSSNVKAKIGSYVATASVSKFGPDILEVTVRKMGRDPISALLYTIPEPVAGEKPGKIGLNTIPANALIGANEIDASLSWKVSEDGKTYSDMKADASFEAGKYYRINVHSKYKIILVLQMFSGQVSYNEDVSYTLGAGIASYVNGKNVLDEGVLDADGYVCFKCAHPEQKSDDKKDDTRNQNKNDEKQDQKTDQNKEDSKKDGTDKQITTEETGPIDGVGTISGDGKVLTDETGKKYRVSEKVKTSELKTNTKIADKKSGGKYRITKLIKKNGQIVGGTVEYMAPYNRNCKLISATGIVKFAGIKFKVTSIAPNCAKGCNKLNKVVLGTYITNIGKNAFKDCKKLRIITIKGNRLKTVGSNAFKGINKKATINVPKVKKRFT